MTSKLLPPAAAVVFGDPCYASMLENELRLAGFEISGYKKADLILADKGSLPQKALEDKKRRMILFCRDGDCPEAEQTELENIYRFSYIFDLEELEGVLKKLYAELLCEKSTRKSPPSVKKSSKNREKEISSADLKTQIYTLEDSRDAMVCGKRIRLSANEWKILDMLCLAAERGEPVSREELAGAIGHPDDSGNIADVYVCRLRRKLDIPMGRRFIFTVRGEGYSLGRLSKGRKNEKRI